MSTLRRVRAAFVARWEGWRWNRAAWGHVGTGLRVGAHVHFTHTERIVIGDNCGIGPECVLDGLGGITLGRNVVLAPRVIIWSDMHRFDGEGLAALPFDFETFDRPVMIGDHVWVGWGASILPGVHIGDGAVIGMGSVVTSDVPPLAIVAGNPARRIRDRDASIYAQLVARGAEVPKQGYAVRPNLAGRHQV